jgi:FKBP-type peptidyl-prolyl cis-trans isomerase
MVPVGAAVLVLAGCGYADPYQANGPVASVEQTTPTPVPGADTFDEGANLKLVTFPDGVKYANIKKGNGARATTGSTITAQYTLFLQSTHAKIDSSRDPGRTPLTGVIDPINGSFIPGFVEGVTGMQVGGKRRIIVPASRGYGSDPNNLPPGIPAGATLVFIVELQGVSATPSPSPSATPS